MNKIKNNKLHNFTEKYQFKKKFCLTSHFYMVAGCRLFLPHSIQIENTLRLHAADLPF